MAKRFNEEEIVRILKEAEEFGNVREVIRKHNVSEQSFLPLAPEVRVARVIGGLIRHVPAR